MHLSNLVYIIILILLIIILVILYFFSNNIRKNKNNLNIVESNMQALQDKVGALQDKIGFLENKLQSSSSVNPNNFSDMLNQLNSINQEMIPDNMMFNMNQENNENDFDDSDDDSNDDSDDNSDDNSDNDSDDNSDNDSDDDSDNNSNNDSDDDSDDENDLDNNSDNEIDNESKNEEESKENLEIVSEIPVVNEEEFKQEELNDESTNNTVVEEINTDGAIGIDDVTPVEEVVETKPKLSKKYPTTPIQDCNVGTIEIGSDGETSYRVALNKAGRKFWKKVA